MRLERLEGLEAHVEVERVSGHVQLVALKVEQNRPLDYLLVSLVDHVDFKAEGIVLKQLLEAREVHLELLFKRLTRPCLEVEISLVGGALGYTSQRIFPLELLGHTHYDGGSALGHCLRREGVRDLKRAQRSNVELVALQKQSKDFSVFICHVDFNSSWLFERILEA